jgi:hypothetical protein
VPSGVSGTGRIAIRLLHEKGVHAHQGQSGYAQNPQHGTGV